MIKLGIVMDPIDSIDINKDTSFAILLKAQQRNYQLYYMEIGNLFLRNGKPYAQTRSLFVERNHKEWYRLGAMEILALSELNVLLMRKNPPIDNDFFYATYILECAENQGVLVVNNPRGLRDCNEKIYASHFDNLIPETLVSSDKKILQDFWLKLGDIILKPLDGMGGASVFLVKKGDPNFPVIVDFLTCQGKSFCMAQAYLPDIKDGDKRVLLVDGQPVPYCLARIPLPGEVRGNLAAGGYGKPQKLSSSDWKIAEALGPVLQSKGLILVGIDIIGDKLTEINITSPTCVTEIESVYPITITGMVLDAIEKRIDSNKSVL
jgi:glutathione synthase